MPDEIPRWHGVPVVVMLRRLRDEMYAAHEVIDEYMADGPWALEYDSVLRNVEDLIRVLEGK